MDNKELAVDFIKYWKKTNKDNFFDSYDVKYSLRNFFYKRMGYEPDFRKKEYVELWQIVKKEILN